MTIICLALRYERFTLTPMKTLLLLAALCLPCAAKLGENGEQLVARYGEPVKIIQTPLPEMRIMMFRKGQQTITVGVLNGVSSDEAYEPVTREEAAKILAGADLKWTYAGERNGGRLWQCGTTLALLNSAGVFYIATQASRDAQKKITELRNPI